MTTENNTPEQPKSFDVITTGLGYLNRAKTIEPKKGKPYMVVTVCLLAGLEPNVEKRYVDCIVVGAKAKELVQQYEAQINDEKVPVMAGVVIGDIYAEAYTKTRGADAGKPGAALKGRLIRISHLSVNKEKIDLGTDDKADGDESEQDEVQLDTAAPDFKERAEQLMAAGYQCVDPVNSVWKKAA